MLFRSRFPSVRNKDKVREQKFDGVRGIEPFSLLLPSFRSYFCFFLVLCIHCSCPFCPSPPSCPCPCHCLLSCCYCWRCVRPLRVALWATSLKHGLCLLALIGRKRPMKAHPEGRGGMGQSVCLCGLCCDVGVGVQDEYVGT